MNSVLSVYLAWRAREIEVEALSDSYRIDTPIQLSPLKLAFCMGLNWSINGYFLQLLYMAALPRIAIDCQHCQLLKKTVHTPIEPPEVGVLHGAQ